MSAKDITELFNKFAGREVPMVEKHVILGNGQPYTDILPADFEHSVLQEMEDLAYDNDLSIDFQWAGGPGLRTWCFGEPERYVVAEVKKDDDGKYRVTGKVRLSHALK